MRRARGIRARWWVVGLCVFWTLAACTRAAKPLTQESLFTLHRGFLPDEVAPVRGDENQELLLGQVGISPSASVYLSDPVSRKLMVLSNYGDLLGLFYNPDDNLWANTAAAEDFTAWPFQGIQNFLVTRERVYVVDAPWPTDKARVLVFRDTGEHLYTINQRYDEGEPSVLRGLQEDDEQRLVLVGFRQESWMLDWFEEGGNWLSNRQLVYEREVEHGVEVKVSVWPAFAPWQVFYQKMTYSAGNDEFPGGKGGWNLTANEVWAYDAVSDTHSLLFSLKGDYVDSTILGLLRDDRLVTVYYQGGKMVVVPYDRKGTRGKAAALSTSRVPTRYALAPSGLLVSAEYLPTKVELSWWRLDGIWSPRRG